MGQTTVSCYRATAAAALLHHVSPVADAIDVDAGHEEDEVLNDLVRFWTVLRAGGVVRGDHDSSDWPGVIAAVDRFCSERGLDLSVDNGKWLVCNPL